MSLLCGCGTKHAVIPSYSFTRGFLSLCGEKLEKRTKKSKNKISNPITHSICLDSLLTSISSSSLDDPSPRQLLLSLYLLFYCFTSADDSDNASMLHTLYNFNNECYVAKL